MIGAWSSWFLWPAAASLLTLIGLAWWVLGALHERAHRGLTDTLGRRFSREVEAPANCRRRHLHVCLGSLALAIVALMQPWWGFEARSTTNPGVDVIFCLDVSRSMLAGDVPPDRLTAARRQIASICHDRGGDRFGLVAFAGDARLIVPLTSDLASLAQMVATTDTLAVSRPGTDLGTALDLARAALGASHERARAIVLLTDGEDHGARGAVAAATCRKQGIDVHCVAMGSPLGSKIVVTNEGRESFLRTRDGRQIVTATDEAGLRRIASVGGGEFASGDLQETTMKTLYDARLAPMAHERAAHDPLSRRRNRYAWPLLAALCLALLGTLLARRSTVTAESVRPSGVA